MKTIYVNGRNPLLCLENNITETNILKLLKLIDDDFILDFNRYLFELIGKQNNSKKLT